MDENFLTDILAADAKSKKVTFTIKSDVLTNFRNLAKAKKYNQSKIIEKMIKKFIEAETTLVN